MTITQGERYYATASRNAGVQVELYRGEVTQVGKGIWERYVKRAEKKIEGKEIERESERGDNELGLRNDRRNTDDSQPRHGLITGVDITKGYADHEFVIGSL